MINENRLLELAELSPVAYDQVRESESKQHKIRVGTLDNEVEKRRAKETEAERQIFHKEPDPWPDPVDTAWLLDELVYCFNLYLVLPDGAAPALALWTMFSWTHDLSHVSPILCFASPEKRCGKTTALSLVKGLTPRSILASNITPAALFRSIEKWRPTLIIDEADTFLRDNDELRGVINASHVREAAFVVRTVGENHDPQLFSTWCPKVIALIGSLPDTLEDRAIVISMRRKQPNDAVAPLRADAVSGLAGGHLPRKLSRWAIDYAVDLRAANPDVPHGLNDRAVA